MGAGICSQAGKAIQQGKTSQQRADCSMQCCIFCRLSAAIPQARALGSIGLAAPLGAPLGTPQVPRC